MISKWIRPLFVVAGAYDLVLGVGFALGFRALYARFGIALPNHDAYVQLPGALIAIFGIGFLMVARDPARNRNLIILGVLLKLAFAGLVLGHRLYGGIPDMWVLFAVADLLFMLAFVAAFRTLPEQGP